MTHGNASESVSDILASWQRLYRDELGIEVDTANVRIPERPNYPAWLILVVQGITSNRVIEACRKHFGINLPEIEDHDAATKDRNDRESIQTYAVWVRATVAADEELANLSVVNCKARKIVGITLLERLLLELRYFLETGEHLDPETITLCNGSRDSLGDVPYVRWISRFEKLSVDWCGRQDRRPNLRARLVIS